MLKTQQKFGQHGLSIDFPLISQQLKKKGYYTATVGKWHVGLDGDESYRPENRDFDYSTIWYEKEESCQLACAPDIKNVSDENQSIFRPTVYPYGYFAYNLTRQHFQAANFPNGVTCHQVYQLNKDNICTTDTQNYLPNMLTNEVTSMLNTVNDNILATPAHEPFFINLWYYTPHLPVHIPPDYKQQLQCGTKNESEACSYEIGYNLSLSGSNQPIISYENNCEDTENRNPYCDGRIGQYALQMSYIDRNIQKVVQTIEKMYSANKLKNETIVVITSDNGGAPQVHANWGGHGGSADDSVSCKENQPESECDIKLRGRKLQLFERGIKVPLAIRFFGYSQKENTGVNHEFITSRDFYPTLSSLAGVDLTEESNAYGINFSNLLNSEPLSFFDKTRAEFWQGKTGPAYMADTPSNINELMCDGSPGQQPPKGWSFNYSTGGYHQTQQFAVRQGKWKLVYEPALFARKLSSMCNVTEANYLLFEINDDEYNAKYQKVNEYYGTNLNDKRPDVVGFLQNSYYKWHNLVGFIDYQLNIDPILTDDMIDIQKHCPNDESCETVSINNSTRLNIGVAHFSFSTFINVAENSKTCNQLNDDGVATGDGMIAFKPSDDDQPPHSWKLKLLNGKPQVSIWLANNEQDIYEKVVLSSDDPIICGKDHHIAFTIQGSRKAGPLMKFFVDGKEKDRVTITHPTNLQSCLDSEPDSNTYCPPHWKILDMQKEPNNIIRPRVVRTNQPIYLGNKPSQANLFNGLIAKPLLSTVTLSNEEIRMLSLSRELELAYKAHKIDYTPCLENCLTEDHGPVPEFDEKKQAWLFPNDGTNNAVLEITDDSKNKNPINFSSDLISFTTKFRLNQNALTPPQNTNMIAAQSAEGGYAWNLKLSPYETPANSGQYEAGIKFNVWFGSCKLKLHTQANNSSDKNFASLREGEAHDIGISIYRAKKMAELYLDGVKIMAQSAAQSCGDMLESNHIYLGNSYRDCAVANDPYSCEPFNGLIYSPRISNQLLMEDGFKWNARTQFLK